MKYVETQQSKNLKKLNQDYLDIYYSKAYQKSINRRVRKLTPVIIINEFKTGYFIKRLKSMFLGELTGNKLESDNPKRSIDVEERIAVYTVIIGGYDTLKQPMFVSEQCDYYVVTDQEIKTDGTCWKRIDLNSYQVGDDFSNTKKARYVKTHPEVFFSDYKYSIFLDGNFLIVSDVVPLVEMLGSGSFATHLHPINDCIYQEAKDIVALGKASEKEVEQQLAQYKQEGFPMHFGLCETNVLVREHLNPECIAIDQAWWDQMEKYTLRDQLSLTYVVWKTYKSFDWIKLLGANPRKNPILRYLSHK